MKLIGVMVHMMDDGRTVSSDTFFALLRQFPNRQGGGCYPYNVIIDLNSYDESVRDELEQLEYWRPGAFVNAVKLPFPNLLVYAIGEDDAVIVTKHEFDLSAFDPKYHSELENCRKLVMTLDTFKNEPNDEIMSLENKVRTYVGKLLVHSCQNANGIAEAVRDDPLAVEAVLHNLERQGEVVRASEDLWQMHPGGCCLYKYDAVTGFRIYVDHANDLEQMLVNLFNGEYAIKPGEFQLRTINDDDRFPWDDISYIAFCGLDDYLIVE